MTTQVREQILIRTRNEGEQYNPVLVDDLINGLNDWRAVQDIVRLTFKALSDVVKSQGASLKEIEAQLPGKALKSEMSQCLLMKNNYTELTRSLSELTALVEGKMNTDDVYSIVEDKVSRNDLQYLLGAKASYEELQTSLSEKADLNEVQSELRALRAIIEEMNEENYRKFQLCASKRELQQVQTLAETKANKDEVTEALEEKANKQSVANALHRKSNKGEIEALIATKVETTEYNKLFESVQEIHSQLLLQIEKSENQRKNEKDEVETTLKLLQTSQKDSEIKYTSYFSKLESYTTSLKSKFEEMQNSTNTILQTSQKDIDNKLLSYFSKLESYNTFLKSKLEDLQNSTNISLNKKCEMRDLDKLIQNINRKADNDTLKDLSNTIQSELKEQMQIIIHESHKFQELLNEKCGKQDLNLKSLQNEIMQIYENIRNVSESSRVNLEEGIKSVHHYTGSKLEDVKGLRFEIEKIYREIEDIRHRNIEKSEFWKNIENKVDNRELKEYVDKYGKDMIKHLQINGEELKDLILRKEKELLSIIEKKIGIYEVNNLISESNTNRMQKISIEELYKDDRSIRNNHIKTDSCTDSLQKDLSRIRLELDGRISSFITEQNSLNEMLCSENCVARWIWRSGDVRTGFSIPWEIESVNTCPDNFIWEVGNTSVIAAAPGLYEITFAIFARKKPNIEVLVNGQAIFIEFNCAGKNWGRHSDGNIVAASTIDFITLPARARVSMTYSGELGAEGFIGLRKL